MRLVLLAVGRMKAGPERDLLRRYADRATGLARSVGLTGFELRELDESRAKAAAERRRDEARAIARDLGPGARIVALDERGQPVSSEGFADLVGSRRDGGAALLAVVVGGPDGLADEVRAGADRCIAYGAATFPHQLVRVMAAEQIYRAMTILARHPYHRG